MQIEKLVDLPVIRDVMALSLVNSLVAGFLPQLVLRLFFALMPYILALLERLAGLPAESEVEWGVVRKYFSFQVSLLYSFTGALTCIGDYACPGCCCTIYAEQMSCTSSLNGTFHWQCCCYLGRLYTILPSNKHSKGLSFLQDRHFA